MRRTASRARRSAPPPPGSRAPDAARTARPQSRAGHGCMAAALPGPRPPSSPRHRHPHQQRHARGAGRTHRGLALGGAQPLLQPVRACGVRARRVRLVREEGRVVYSQYGREGGARPPGALPPPPRPALTCQRDETCPISTEGCTRRVHFVRKGGGEGSAAPPRAQGSCHGGVAARRRASRRAACGARLGVRAGGRVADRALRSSSTRRSSSAPVRRAASRRACPRRRVRAPQG